MSDGYGLLMVLLNKGQDFSDEFVLKPSNEAKILMTVSSVTANNLRAKIENDSLLKPRAVLSRRWTGYRYGVSQGL